MTSFYQRLDHGITVVDTGFVRPRFDASFLIVENGRAAFIETGPNSAVPRLLAALEAHGLERDAVDYVIPTHVHLDHAGGAGLLMQKNVSIHWEFMFTRSLFQTPDIQRQHEILEQAAALIDNGTLRTTLAESLGPINAANLRRAHQMLERGRTIGKLVLEGFN